MDKKNCCVSSEHPSHEAELVRINRILGQVAGIKKMVEEHRYCMDIISQIRAARSALKSVERNILKTHLQNCVVQSFCSEMERENKIKELTQLFEHFDD